jgi:hypothetical protein
MRLSASTLLSEFGAKIFINVREKTPGDPGRIYVQFTTEDQPGGLSSGSIKDFS